MLSRSRLLTALLFLGRRLGILRAGIGLLLILVVGLLLLHGSCNRDDSRFLFHICTASFNQPHVVSLSIDSPRVACREMHRVRVLLTLLLHATAVAL